MRSSSIPALMATAFVLSGPCGGSAKADAVYLDGAELFAASATGATVNTGYQYDTNVNNGSDYLVVNGQGGSPKNISIALSVGVNNFTFTSQSGYPVGAVGGSNADIGLFFGTTSDSYDPTSPARTADLLGSVASGGANDFTPTAGTAINDYRYIGSNVANGLTTFSIGGENITLTAFSASNGPNNNEIGTFTLLVAPTVAVPEPASITLLAIGLAGNAIAIGVRRRAANASRDLLPGA